MDETARGAARAPARSPALAALLGATPARLAIGRTGPRLRARVYLQLLADHARARDAVTSEVPASFVRRLGLREITTGAATREAYLREPARGRALAPESLSRLRRCRQRPEVQLALADGLSSTAVIANGPTLLRALTRTLRARGRRLGTPLFVRNGRVRVQDEIGAILRPEVFCFIVGERPGLATAESLSAYILYRPSRGSAEPDRTVVANIHRKGLAPSRAAERIADLVDEILARRASGAALAASRTAGTLGTDPRTRPPAAGGARRRRRHGAPRA
jgi:ethanolamine ammonia-lyase small subunit